MRCSGMLHRVALVRTDATCCMLRFLGTANVVPSSPILVILMMEAILSSGTSVLTRSTRHHIPEDGILQNKGYRQFMCYFRCCREFKEKINVVDHRNNDTVSFNPRDTWYFNGRKSEGLTGHEMLTIPHPALLVRSVSH
jgi:hypothetical protein